MNEQTRPTADYCEFMQTLRQIRPTKEEYGGSGLQKNSKFYLIIMDNLAKYFRDTAAELKQVTWPTQQQAIFYTILVVVISALVAAYIGAFDYVFSQGINAIIRQF